MGTRPVEGKPVDRSNQQPIANMDLIKPNVAKKYISRSVTAGVKAKDGKSGQEVWDDAGKVFGNIGKKIMVTINQIFDFITGKGWTNDNDVKYALTRKISELQRETNHLIKTPFKNDEDQMELLVGVFNSVSLMREICRELKKYEKDEQVKGISSDLKNLSTQTREEIDSLEERIKAQSKTIPTLKNVKPVQRKTAEESQSVNAGIEHEKQYVLEGLPRNVEIIKEERETEKAVKPTVSADIGDKEGKKYVSNMDIVPSGPVVDRSPKRERASFVNRGVLEERQIEPEGQLSIHSPLKQHSPTNVDIIKEHKERLRSSNEIKKEKAAEESKRLAAEQLKENERLEKLKIVPFVSKILNVRERTDVVKEAPNELEMLEDERIALREKLLDLGESIDDLSQRIKGGMRKEAKKLLRDDLHKLETEYKTTEMKYDNKLLEIDDMKNQSLAHTQSAKVSGPVVDHLPKEEISRESEVIHHPPTNAASNVTPKQVVASKTTSAAKKVDPIAEDLIAQIKEVEAAIKTIEGEQTKLRGPIIKGTDLKYIQIPGIDLRQGKIDARNLDKDQKQVLGRVLSGLMGQKRTLNLVLDELKDYQRTYLASKASTGKTQIKQREAQPQEKVSLPKKEAEVKQTESAAFKEATAAYNDAVVKYNLTRSNNSGVIEERQKNVDFVEEAPLSEIEVLDNEINELYYEIESLKAKEKELTTEQNRIERMPRKAKALHSDELRTLKTKLAEVKAEHKTANEEYDQKLLEIDDMKQIALRKLKLDKTIEAYNQNRKIEEEIEENVVRLHTQQAIDRKAELIELGSKNMPEKLKEILEGKDNKYIETAVKDLQGSLGKLAATVKYMVNSESRGPLEKMLENSFTVENAKIKADQIFEIIENTLINMRIAKRGESNKLIIDKGSESLIEEFKDAAAKYSLVVFNEHRNELDKLRSVSKLAKGMVVFIDKALKDNGFEEHIGELTNQRLTKMKKYFEGLSVFDATKNLNESARSISVEKLKERIALTKDLVKEGFSKIDREADAPVVETGQLLKKLDGIEAALVEVEKEVERKIATSIKTFEEKEKSKVQHRQDVVKDMRKNIKEAVKEARQMGGWDKKLDEYIKELLARENYKLSAGDLNELNEVIAKADEVVAIIRDQFSALIDEKKYKSFDPIRELFEEIEVKKNQLRKMAKNKE